MNFRLILAPVALAALTWSSAAQAALTVYTTQSSFLAAVSAPGVDDYDDLDYTSPLATPQPRTAGSYSYTASAGPTSGFFPASDDGIDVWLSTGNRTDTITFNSFSAAVRGVGAFFFSSDIDGLSTTTPATLTVTATDASGTVSQALVNPGVSTFLGFVSNGPITSLTVFVGTKGVGTAGVWPTVNDLTLGASVGAVPEPATYGLLIGGLALVGVAARRGRKA